MTERNWFSNFVKLENPILLPHQQDFPSKDGSYETVECWTVENVYQASKAIDWDDQVRIAQLPPGQAKRAGQRIVLRPNWIHKKLGVMEMALRLKFARDTEQARLLLATGDEAIVEWNTWHDNFWGSCTCWDCDTKKALNMLGMLLMVIRQQLDEGVI